MMVGSASIYPTTLFIDIRLLMSDRHRFQSNSCLSPSGWRRIKHTWPISVETRNCGLYTWVAVIYSQLCAMNPQWMPRYLSLCFQFPQNDLIKSPLTQQRLKNWMPYRLYRRSWVQFWVCYSMPNARKVSSWFVVMKRYGNSSLSYLHG